MDYGTQILSVKWDGDSVDNPTMTGTAAADSYVTFGDVNNWKVDDYYGMLDHNALGIVNVAPTKVHPNSEDAMPYQFEITVPCSAIPEGAKTLNITMDGWKYQNYKTYGNCMMEVVHYAEFDKYIMGPDLEGTDPEEMTWYTVCNEVPISEWMEPEWDEIRIFVVTWIGPSNNNLKNCYIDNLCVYAK